MRQNLIKIFPLNRWSKESALVENEPILQEKIRLLGVMEMTFRRDANDRQVTFKDIANETGLPEENVELLVSDPIDSIF
jgi:26S proteasome regulatory subunit N9